MVKVIYIPTNFNNKMACGCFIHIDEAPRTGIPESRLENTVVEIRTSDNSHPPVKTKLNDLLRIKLGELSSTITWPSHGMDAFQFAQKEIESKPRLTAHSQMAVYFYERIKD